MEYLMPTNNFTVLIVEDDEPKLRAISQFFADEFPEAKVCIAQSLSAAINSLVALHTHFAVVDMSLPTYDFSADRAGGGKPQGFGGADILRFIEAESSWTNSVVLTQYEEFPIPDQVGRRSLSDLSDELRMELGAKFIGVIHYSGQHGEWRSQLKNITQRILESEK
jgi:CheY-like chemotaxis protein